MLLVSLFQSPEPKSRAHNAIARAIDVKPAVTLLLTDPIDRESYYIVKRQDKISKHIVRTFEDRDGTLFVECDCPAARPAVDSVTRLPTFEPVPCLHAASVLISIAENEKEN